TIASISGTPPGDYGLPSEEFLLNEQETIYFLRATYNSSGQSGYITLGTLGYCLSVNGNETCTKPSIGYEFSEFPALIRSKTKLLTPRLPDPNTLLGNDTRLQIPTVVAKWLTYALFLHVIALALSGVSAIFGLLAHIREFSMSCFSSCISGMAAAICLIAFIVDLVLFFVAKARINSIDGASAMVGNAVWLTLAAWILLFISGCAFGIGRCCISRRPREPKASKASAYAPNSNGNATLPPDPNAAYAEQMRMDAIKAENSRSPPLPGGYPGGHSQYPSQQSTYPPQNYPQQQSYTRQASQNAYDPYSDQYNYPASSTADQYNYPAPSTTPGAYPPQQSYTPQPQQSYTPQPQAPYSPQHQSSYPIPSQPLVGGNSVQQDLNFPGVTAPAHQHQPTTYASSPAPINTQLPYGSPAAGPPASGWPASPARGPRSPTSPTRLAAWQEESEPSTVGPSTGRPHIPEDAPPDYETSTVGSRNAGYQNEKQTYRP
ncbi:hypothetical protein FRC00_002331, partial [Tulasnella sp. 408]